MIYFKVKTRLASGYPDSDFIFHEYEYHSYTEKDFLSVSKNTFVINGRYNNEGISEKEYIETEKII